MNGFVRPCAGYAMSGGGACLCWLRLLSFVALIAIVPSQAFGQFQELIINGNFTNVGGEWRTNRTNNPNGTDGCGSSTFPATNCWFLNSPGFDTPLFGLPTDVTADHGQYVIADMTVTGTRELFQTFFVRQPNRPVFLSFDLFVNDWASLPTFDDRQHARVDITTNTAPPFDMTATHVLFNAYLGTDGGPLPNPFRHYEFDISPAVAAGGNFRVRFFATNVINNGLPINVGVDNVSVLFIPEPGTLGLAAASVLIGIVAAARRRKV